MVGAAKEGLRRHIATENRTFEEALADFLRQRDDAIEVMLRLKNVTSIPEAAAVLEVGAGAGQRVIALTQAGYRVTGIEPSEAARSNAATLAKRIGVDITMIKVVLACSVVEHVIDLARVFSEVYRVLKPGGVFYFSTASSMCPRQEEIRGFPLFGWYPDRLKRHIMDWAKTHKPHLVNYTETPAIHWFTPAKANRLLRQVGFREVYDRWDLRSRARLGGLKRGIVKAICACVTLRAVADVILPGCAYAGVK
jgi:SAM-dependent methyltransferase